MIIFKIFINNYFHWNSKKHSFNLIYKIIYLENSLINILEDINILLYINFFEFLFNYYKYFDF